MKRRFLLYRLSHTVLVVDISEIGLPTEIYPPEGKEQKVQTIRFQSQRDAEQYLLRAGAVPEVIEKASAQFSKTGFDVLSIP